MKDVRVRLKRWSRLARRESSQRISTAIFRLHSRVNNWFTLFFVGFFLSSFFFAQQNTTKKNVKHPNFNRESSEVTFYDPILISLFNRTFSTPSFSFFTVSSSSCLSLRIIIIMVPHEFLLPTSISEYHRAYIDGPICGFFFHSN